MTDKDALLEFFLIERHLDRMMQIVRDLGDDLANTAPPLPGANSAYQIVFHCCGMLEWWTREALLGVDVGRDRDAEFVSHGSVDELQQRVDDVTAQLSQDLTQIDLDAPPRGDPGDYRGTPIAATALGVLMHVFEELAQHHGHVEITRDLLRSG